MPFQAAPSLAVLFSILALEAAMARNYCETNGIVLVEAEDYAVRALSETRASYRIFKGDSGMNIEDRDRNHAATASGES